MTHYCTSSACPAQTRARLLHWVSRAAMDVRGIGPAIVDALMRQYHVSNVADLYELTPDDWRNLRL